MFVVSIPSYIPIEKYTDDELDRLKIDVSNIINSLSVKNKKKLMSKLIESANQQPNKSYVLLPTTSLSIINDLIRRKFEGANLIGMNEILYVDKKSLDLRDLSELSKIQHEN